VGKPDRTILTRGVSRWIAARAARSPDNREPVPSMVMVDAQTVKGGRYGPKFHAAGGRDLLRDRIDELPRLRAIVGDRAYRGLQSLASRRHVALDIKAPPPGVSGFVPIRPLDRIEHAFAQLGRWRRLSRCYEGTEASARAWLEVASVGYLAWRAAA